MAIALRIGRRLNYAAEEHRCTSVLRASTSSTALLHISRLDEEVDALARQIAGKLTLAVAMGKEAFYRQAELGLEAAYAFTAEVMTKNMLARDTEEGVDAFLEKRQPRWNNE